MRDILVTVSANLYALTPGTSNNTDRRILDSNIKHGITRVANSGGNASVKTRWNIVTDMAPLLLELKPALRSKRKRRLKYYTWLAAKLAEEGRLEDFATLVKGLTEAGANVFHFMQALDMNLICAGFGRQIQNGNFYSVVETLSKIHKVGCHSPRFLDVNARQLLSKECWKLLEQGNVEKCVRIMEILSDCLFPVKDFVEPTFIIQQCARQKDVTLALRYVNVLPRMRVWFNFVIHEFGKRGDLKSALIAFQELEKSTIGPDMYSYRDIIDACGLCGQPVRARNIFKELINQKISPNVFLYNSLMNVNAGDLNYVLQIYKHMQTSGVTPDVTTYNILLKACCIVGKVDSAEFFYKEVLNRAAAGNLKLDLITYSTMIQVFGEAKMWEKAMEVKMDMIAAGVTPDIVTWTTLIGACANAGLVEQAIQFFDEMVLSGCEPNTQCCNNLLHACVESCQYARAFQLFHTWKKNGFYETSAQRHKEHIPLAEPEVTLDAEKSKSENLNHEIQASIPSFDTHPFRMSQFKPTIVTYNILMKACGTSPHHAKALMKEMEILGLLPNHISWSILIDAYGNLGDLRGVLQTFKRMRDVGIKPDVITYTTIIKACVRSKNPEKAFLIFERMKKLGLQPNVVTYNTLLRSRRTYGDLPEVQQSLAIYEEMRKAGYAPNDNFLKGLLEEWSEGVIQHNNRKNQDGLSKEKLIWEENENTGDLCTYAGLLLEKIAAHARSDGSDNLMIDLHGLTKTEARIAVLAVLRIIRERHGPENPIRDDLIIITGMGKHTNIQDNKICDAIIEVLQDELGLPVLYGYGDEPVLRRRMTSKDEISDNSDNHDPVNHGISTHQEPDMDIKTGTKSGDSNIVVRRPPNVGRLRISRKALNQWLRKKDGRGNYSLNSWRSLCRNGSI